MSLDHPEDEDIAMRSRDESEQPPVEKAYHSKRAHRKSRAGCLNCKTRKVKCDEAHPSCRSCTLRKVKCNYPTSSAPASPKPVSASSASSRSPTRLATPEKVNSPGGRGSSDGRNLLLLQELSYSPPECDATDMKMLWFYTTNTYQSFNTNATKLTAIDDVLKIKIIQYGFQNSFLMNTVLGITAQHMKFLGVDVPVSKAIAYRVNAFEGYRKAIEDADPETFPALLASSLLLCAVAAAQFREEGARPLYILDWILVWRGIGLIIDLCKPQIMYDSGMQALFYRPPIDLNTSALHIPSNLLFMVTSLKEGDEDFPNIDLYYETLKYLGALYKELLNGFGGILDLTIITFFTFLPPEFVILARARRPRALVIIAHYLAFVRCCNGPWWMIGIADREIENVCNLLDSGDDTRPTEWTSLVRVPRAVGELSDRTEVAKVLLDNHTWTPPSMRHDAEDAERTSDLSWVDDTGRAIAFTGEFVYEIPTRQKPWFNTYSPDEKKELGAFGLDTVLPNADAEYMQLMRTGSEDGTSSGPSFGSNSSAASP